MDSTILEIMKAVVPLFITTVVLIALFKFRKEISRILINIAHSTDRQRIKLGDFEGKNNMSK